MTKSKKMVYISLAAMMVISVLCLFNIKNLSSFVLIIGLVMYFISKARKESEDYLSFKDIPKSLKDVKVIILMLMPIASCFVSIFLSKSIMPTYVEHITSRTGFLPVDKIIILIPSLLIAACGEEIAMRGFMQAQLTKLIKFVPALIITSILFAMCHISSGPMDVVLYDLAFIAIDSIFYGLIFKKTNNIWVCTIAHFIANTVSLLVFMK